MILIIFFWILGHLFGVNTSIFYAIFSAVFILWSRTKSLNSKSRFFLFLLVALTLRGYIHGNEVVLILKDFLKFLLFGYVAFALKLTERSFTLTSKRILIIGILAFVGTFLFHDFSLASGREVFAVGVYEPAKYISGSLMLVLLGFPRVTRRVMKLSYSGLLFTILWGLLSETRAFVIFPLFVILVRLYLNSKVLMFLFSFLSVIAFLVMISSGLDLGRYSTSVLNGRDLEAIYYIADCTKDEIIFGRGLGGVNKTWIWQDVDKGSSMMHLGLMYILMKGGLILVLVYLSWFASKIFFSKNNLGLVYFVFFIQDFFTSQWLFLPGVLILGLIINISYGYERRYVGA